MHEILTTTRDNLTDRAAELESLIKAGEERCQALADEGNRQIKVITDKAGADIGTVQAELEKQATELAGVQHSIGTIDAIADATRSESPKVTPINGNQPMSLAEAGAAMQRHQHEDDRRQARSVTLSLDGSEIAQSSTLPATLPEKKQP